MKFTLRRALRKIEYIHVEAIDWDDARKKLEAFKASPLPEDCLDRLPHQGEYKQIEHTGRSDYAPGFSSTLPITIFTP